MAVKLYQIPSPTLADKAVQTVQEALAKLTYRNSQNQSIDWFSELYPISEVSESERIPQFRISPERYENIQPNNRQKAMGFFILHEDELLPNYDHLLDLSLIVWFDTRQYLPAEPRAVREYFITDILHLFRANRPNLEVQEIFRDKREVWQAINHNSFLPSDVPFAAFRIRFDLEARPDCGTPLVFSFMQAITPDFAIGLIQETIEGIDLIADTPRQVLVTQDIDLETVVYPAFYLGDSFLAVRLISVDNDSRSIWIESEINITGGRLNIIGRKL